MENAMTRALILGATALALSAGAASAQAIYVTPGYGYAAPAYVAPAPVYVAPPAVYAAPPYYGPPAVAVAPPDDEKLSDVLHKLDEPSLSHLIRDHRAGYLKQICRS